MKLCITVFLVTALLCTGCYRMPEEDEISAVPNTNNPKYAAKGNPNAALLPRYDY